MSCKSNMDEGRIGQEPRRWGRPGRTTKREQTNPSPLRKGRERSLRAVAPSRCARRWLIGLLILLTVPWASGAERRLLITDNGAVGDGLTLNTKAIQETINRCAGEGGGVVVVPKGKFITGSIFLKQGAGLEVEQN